MGGGIQAGGVGGKTNSQRLEVRVEFEGAGDPPAREDARPTGAGLINDLLQFVFFGQRFDFVFEQAALFQEAAKILFAGVAVFAFLGVEVFEDFIADFQPLEVNDADVFGAVFPNLALLQF